jgi:hypothetical protein
MEEKEFKKLSILLDHWIEHNVEHAEEFKEWAEKARGLGNGSIAAHINAAADYTVKANKSLQDAIDALKQGI